MSFISEYKSTIALFDKKYNIPPISHIFIPNGLVDLNGKITEFISIGLEGGATGISFIPIEVLNKPKSKNINSQKYIGRNPTELALQYGNENPLENMLEFAAINAIHQHIMKIEKINFDYSTDSLGLTQPQKNDIFGMVGLFRPLVMKILDSGAQLHVIEKNKDIIGAKSPFKQFDTYDISSNPKLLLKCNKIICTSVTVLNGSLENILSFCNPNSFVSIIGPTAGYLPDILFNKGIDVIGGTKVINQEVFFYRLENNIRWGDSTKKYCFQKKTYNSLQI
jgi:uncharacterized protein (DUF4213/DUF364 family)